MIILKREVRLEKQHVLIIDDDKDTADLFGTVLKLVGFECLNAYSVKQAFNCLATSQPDMILLDLRLGLEVGGEDILYQIRSNPRLEKTRVIIITAYPSIAEPLKNLADLTLLKPIDVEQLKLLACRLVQDKDSVTPNYFLDYLTGVNNKDFFMVRLGHVFERFKRRPELLFGLLSIEVDFNCINEEMPGENNQKILLTEIARRIVGCFRPTDTKARFRGNQFVTLHEDLKQPEDIQVLVTRLRRSLAAPFKIEDLYFPAHTAIGAVLLTTQYQKPEMFLDAAMEKMVADRIPIEEDLKVH